MKKALVTGGAGFIGSHVVDTLVSQGLEVVVIDNFSSGNVDNIHKDVKCHQGNICDYEFLEFVFSQEKPDYVFHLAAQINLRKSVEFPPEDCKTNVLGSVTLMDVSARHGIEKFVFSSTGGAIYSEIAALPWTEASSARPPSPYGLSKLTVERYLNLYQDLYQLPYVSLRYSNVYGPRQNSKGEAGVVSIFLDNIKEGKDLVIFGDGNQTRDFVYVSDVAFANFMALNDHVRGVFNVSSGKATSVNKLAQKLIDISGSNVSIVHKSPVRGELRHSILDSSKYEGYGWESRIKLSKGLKKTVKHVLKSDI